MTPHNLPPAVTIELYGVPRMRTGVGLLTVAAATVGEALLSLGRLYPELAGSILLGSDVHPAYRLSLNSDRFVTDPATPLRDGDSLLLLSADVGG